MYIKLVLKYLNQALYILDKKIGEKYYSKNLKQMIKCIEEDYIKEKRYRCK